MTWAERRRRTVFRLRLVLGVLYSTAGALVVVAVQYWTGTSGEEMAASLVDWLPDIAKSGPTSVSDQFQRWAAPAPWLAGGLLAVLASFGPCKTAARWLADTIFARFNDDVLRPIRRSIALDPLWGSVLTEGDPTPLPFQLPAAGPRRAAFDALRAMVYFRAGDGTPRIVGSRADGDFAPFRWAVIFGRAGSGKTRFCTEFARHLARRDLFGDSGDVTAAIRSSRVGERLMRLGAWWRTAWPWAVRREADPWDAGWLEPPQSQSDAAAPGAADRTEPDEAWYAAFAEWRPRRPTLLLLDDPLSGVARRVVAILQAQSRHPERPYRFPVRLLIANQAAPAELQLAWREETQDWVSEIASFSGLTIVFSDNAAFGGAEIRALAAAHGFSSRIWSGRDRDVDKILRVTRGNPLLVELGLRELKKLRSLEDLSRHALLNRRAKSIVRAMQMANAGSLAQLRGLAAATLAGGNILASREAIQRQFAIDLLPPDSIRQLFNLGELPAADWGHIPPVRPEIIGDAFVRRIAEKLCGPRERRMIVTAAWLANPEGVLKARRRFIDDDSELGDLLREDPPRDTGLDPVEIAVAYADQAVRIDRLDWQMGEVGDTAKALAAAVEQIAGLSPETGSDNLPRFVDLMHDMPDFISRRDIWLVVMSSIWLQRLLFPAAWSDPLKSFTTGLLFRVTIENAAAVSTYFLRSKSELRWALPRVARAYAQHLLIRSPRDAEGFKSFVIAITELAPDLRAAMAGAMAAGLSASIYGDFPEASLMEVARNTARSVASALLSDRNLSEEDRAAITAFVKEQMKTTGLPSVAVAEVATFEAGLFAEDEAASRASILLAEAVAHGIVGDRDAAEAVARAVETLSDQFPDNEVIASKCCACWNHAGYAGSIAADPGGTERAATSVDRIVARFPDQSDLRWHRAIVWKHVAYVRSTARDRQGTEAAAALVVDVLDSMPADQDRAHLLCEVWKCVAFVRSEVFDVAGTIAAALETDHIAASFPMDGLFARWRGAAWQHVSFAQTKVQSIRPADVVASARRVDEICGGISGNRLLLDLQLSAWKNVTYAYGEARDPAGTAEAARRVDGLAALCHFDHGASLWRVQAWQNLAYACSEVGDPAATLGAVRHVDELAMPFGNNPDFVRWRISAWRNLAYARSNAGDVDGTEEAAREVDRLAAGHAIDAEIAVWIAVAWKCLAFVCSNVADGAGATAAATRVDRIAGDFAGHAEFCLFHVQAWRNAAVACRKAGDIDGTVFAAARTRDITGDAPLHAGMITWRDEAQRQLEIVGRTPEGRPGS